MTNELGLWLEDYLNVLCERDGQEMSLPMRQFLNDRIDSVRAYIANSQSETFVGAPCGKCGGTGVVRPDAVDPVQAALDAVTKPLHEKIEQLERQCAALTLAHYRHNGTSVLGPK